MGDRRKKRDEAGLPARKAQRLQKPSWKDSRLVIGVVLIAASTLGGVMLADRLDSSVEVYQAASGLVPGQELTNDDVTTVKARIGDGSEGYLMADKPLPSGRVVREVRKGELLPASTIGKPSTVGLKAVSVDVEPSFAATLVRGSTVDLWVSERRETTGAAEFAKPGRVVPRAYVLRVPTTNTGGLSVASSQAVAVQVLVPDDLVDEVIGAVNSESKITLVATADSPMRSSQ
ncbi:hypothetical protein [Demetria terragena]|uniref:hypothetical protein n=1 Tax=Demetria terragena TaxID=63959 RepID=UPI00035CFF98|nr:hypothetical protein [Demetria terragena]